jgi:hypothetical protein
MGIRSCGWETTLDGPAVWVKAFARKNFNRQDAKNAKGRYFVVESVEILSLPLRYLGDLGAPIRLRSS